MSDVVERLRKAFEAQRKASFACEHFVCTFPLDGNCQCLRDAVIAIEAGAYRDDGDAG